MILSFGVSAAKFSGANCYVSGGVIGEEARLFMRTMLQVHEGFTQWQAEMYSWCLVNLAAHSPVFETKICFTFEEKVEAGIQKGMDWKLDAFASRKV